MSFKVTMLGAIVLSAAIGGGLAHMRASGSAGSVGEIGSGARDMFRTTMRKFDSRYYTRGPEYGLCVADYGRNVLGKTNAEITFACECFDKSLRMMGGADRQSALDALRPPAPESGPPGEGVARVRTTAPARAVLAKCDIRPAPAGFLSMRGTL